MFGYGWKIKAVQLQRDGLKGQQINRSLQLKAAIILLSVIQWPDLQEGWECEGDQSERQLSRDKIKAS